MASRIFAGGLTDICWRPHGFLGEGLTDFWVKAS
nr:MAG TPA: hypothetical protein [Microviridae sp.]